MNKKNDKNAINTLEKEDVVQAVIIADCYDNAFGPMTDMLPLALLPLVNIPMLDYALESLARSGVQEVFLFCSMHMDQIKAFIKNRVDNDTSWCLTLTVQLVISEGCRSFGDAMRDLDAKGLLRGNFILMDTNVITNANLNSVLEYHKRVLKKDKGAAMTVVYTKGSAVQCTSEDVVIAVDDSNHRMLHHQRANRLRNIELPLEVFLDYAEVTIHHDLKDPGIAVCSPSFLHLFADNFDFQTRDDFIRGLIINEEILASTVYCYPVENQNYSARVANWQMYQLISHDIVNRWTYPLVPNMRLSRNHPTYVQMPNNIYKNTSATLAKGVSLTTDVVIAGGTSISENSTILKTVIGRDCKIGRNVHLSASYVYDGCVIEDDCEISLSVLGRNVKIEKGSNLKSIIVSNNVIIQEKSKLEDYVIRSSKPSDDEKYEELGPAAFAMLTVDPDDSDSECEKIAKKGPGMIPLGIVSDLSDYTSSSEEELSPSQSPVPDDSSVFLSEVIDSLARSYEEKLNCDYLILEINSSRYAYNMALNEVNYYVITALLSLPALQEASDKLAVLKSLFTYFKTVVQNYIKGPSAMSDCLKAVEDICLSDNAYGSRITQIVHFMYSADIVTEEAIFQWHSFLPDELRTSLNKFIEWLKQASEESSEEDSAGS